MASHVYALLVGINDYSPAVGRLHGCRNDVSRFHDYLQDTFDSSRLHVETLLDSDATRGNIIKEFRAHLGRAGDDDVAIFQYCGHGAHCRSAAGFAEFFPDGKDEGLVCYDSREGGSFDLADKELAVLIAEVAANDPHLAVILDCCHSGSSTRETFDLRARETHEIKEERPLESYLDGHYEKLRRDGSPLLSPAGRHVLLAACARVQKAWEGHDQGGVFTSTLLEVLEESGPNASYADLFVRCRAAVRKRAENQDPQFETYRGFSAWSGFLGGETTRTPPRYAVHFHDDTWQLECGAVHGLPADPDAGVELAVFDEDDLGAPLGSAETVQVGAQRSDLALGFDADPAKRYQAELTSVPVAPLPVSLQGDASALDHVRTQLHAAVNPIAVESENAEYRVLWENEQLLLQHSPSGKLIQGYAGDAESAAEYIVDVLGRVASWERALQLQNRNTRMDTDNVRFCFSEQLEDGTLRDYDGDEITLDILQDGDDWHEVTGKLQADNRSAQPLHYTLLHFSEDFGITPFYSERVEPTRDLFTITFDSPDEGPQPVFHLGLFEEGVDEAVHQFLLLVTTEEADSFLFEQEGLTLGEIVSGSRGLRVGRRRPKLHRNEWFVKTLTLRLVRNVATVGQQDTSVADGRITVKAHPSLQAEIGLGSAAATRDVNAGTAVCRALERHGLDLVNFAGTRGDTANVLELTNIRNADSLAENPLEIELDVSLSEDEFLLPLVTDGEHLLLTGEPSRTDDGKAHISIDALPDIPDRTRSLGRALKLYFFKTYLKRKNLNRLCWVEYLSDGSVERHRSGVADRVADANKIILLIHGIIGDTEGIARGLRLAEGADGKPLTEQFDLVLTLDYENLSTPISETARQLKEQLQEVGLHADDQKRLTILAHSMGGLVSRWFIERESGNAVVDHLVMCGTPNGGSPFGRVDLARKLTGLLTTLAVNTFPPLAPFGGALAFLLNRSRKLTPTLEQMNPASEFMGTLNSSEDPGVPYTILAGDIRDYEESSDQFTARLVAQLGSGVLFDTLYDDAAHDIAVAGESIHGVTDERTPAPQKQAVICHHMNYFVSDAGLNALAAIDWGTGADA